MGGMSLPGYDEWKLANPYDLTPAEENEIVAKYNEEIDNLRDAVALTLTDNRGGIYLYDIRKIVIEELNKLVPGAAEPKWQTAMPVEMPGRKP